MTRFEPIETVPRLHTTPLASFRTEHPRGVVVEVDDQHQCRWRLFFETWQAFRVTTADCFSITVPGLSITPNTVVEVVESPWVKELRTTLLNVDCEARFLDQAKHFLIPAQDEFIEVVAWNLICERLSKP